jgi:hypothetical protein
VGDQQEGMGLAASISTLPPVFKSMLQLFKFNEDIYRKTHVDIAVTHVEQMQCVFFISATAWHSSAAGKFQIHIN